MTFDLRLPIGILFSLFGGILIVVGLSASTGIYASSLGINVNIIWGGVLLAFGCTMLFFALRARKPLNRK
jgi:hypothetical protein